jgi:hypothetical protein
MADYERNQPKFSRESDSYYEAVANQEEVYLEETEEELRMILIREDSNESQANGFGSTDTYTEQTHGMVTSAMAKSASQMAQVNRKQLYDAVQELIAGDPDDAPLSEEEVERMLPGTKL